MLGIAAASSPSTPATTASSPYAADTLNTVRRAFQRNNIFTSPPYHSIVSASFHFLSLRSCDAISTKAVADSPTLVVQKHDPQSSAPGNKQALISLSSDMKDLAFLGNGLRELGYTIVSTGGTASALEGAGVSVTKVEQLTCFPEMLDGRVKTLHPNIHGGIHARRDQKHHMEALNRHGIGQLYVGYGKWAAKPSRMLGNSFEESRR